jgi:hypothetical protein
MKYIIEKELLEQIINYLANFKWGEVNNIMQGLLSLKPFDVKKDERDGRKEIEP